MNILEMQTADFSWEKFRECLQKEQGIVRYFRPAALKNPALAEEVVELCQDLPTALELIQFFIYEGWFQETEKLIEKFLPEVKGLAKFKMQTHLLRAQSSFWQFDKALETVKKMKYLPHNEYSYALYGELAFYYYQIFHFDEAKYWGLKSLMTSPNRGS